MTDNTPNQQPEKPAANTAQPIENKPTEPQKQPEKPTPTTQKQPEKTASQQPDSAPQQPIVIQQKASGGRGIATGALVLSLIALGASGFLFVQGQNVLKQQEMRIGQDLNKAALGNSENAALLQSTLAKQAELDAQLSKILQNESDTAQTLDGIHRAYAELLKGRVNWLVDEIEVTLNTASQQLLLSGNVPVATAVLENVEQRLSRFEQPELLPIKQAISQDLAALKNRPYLNVSATALRLDRLESAVDSLPLLVDSTMNAQNAEPAPTSKAGSFWIITMPCSSARNKCSTCAKTCACACWTRGLPCCNTTAKSIKTTLPPSKKPLNATLTCNRPTPKHGSKKWASSNR